MCRDCGCSLGPARRRAHRWRRPPAWPARSRRSRSSPRFSARTMAWPRTIGDAVRRSRRARAEPDVVTGRRRDRAAQGDHARARRAPAGRGDRRRPRHGERRRWRIRACRRACRAGCATGDACRPWTPRSCTTPSTTCRSPVSTCCSSRTSATLVYPRLRSRAASRRRAAVGAGRRRQAREVSGHVPRRGSVPDHEDGPAGLHHRVHHCARARLAAPDRFRQRDHQAHQPRRRGVRRVARVAQSAVEARRKPQAPGWRPRGRRSSPQDPWPTPPEGGPTVEEGDMAHCCQESARTHSRAAVAAADQGHEHLRRPQRSITTSCARRSRRASRSFPRSGYPVCICPRKTSTRRSSSRCTRA